MSRPAGPDGPTWALLGSGEFEPWAEEVDRWALARARPGRVLILPTASAPEGDAVFDRWGRMGREHYARQGIVAEVLPLRVAADAGRNDLVAVLDEAAMVFFSGGNPAYLAETLAGSPFWAAVRDHMAGGLAYAGCSAGAAALGVTALERRRVTAPQPSSFRKARRPGLGALDGLDVVPHWDTVDAFIPGATRSIVESLPPGVTLLAVEERTAAVGDGRRWSVIGSGTVHLYGNGTWRRARAGQDLTI